MDGDDTTTPGRIVVGIDGSAGCKAALGWALRQAARTGAAIEVVAAWGSPVFVSHADLWPVDVDLEAIVHRQVARVLAEVVPAGSTVPVCVTVRRTAPAVALLDAARGRRVPCGGHPWAQRAHRDAARLGEPPLREPRPVPGGGRVPRVVLLSGPGFARGPSEGGGNFLGMIPTR